MNGYSLTERWFSFVAENNDKVECKHTAMYLYIVEMFNKRQWVQSIGLPTDFTMGLLRMSYKTYKNTFDDLVDFGFIVMVEKSKNQYTSNVIALGNIPKADTKALPTHLPKQSESEHQSKSDIDKQLNLETDKQLNKESSFKDFWDLYGKKVDSSKTKEKFLKLSDAEITQILQVVPEYVKSTPDVQFRKNPLTWLRGKCWNDSILQQSTETKFNCTYRNAMGTSKIIHTQLQIDEFTQSGYHKLLSQEPV